MNSGVLKGNLLIPEKSVSAGLGGKLGEDREEGELGGQDLDDQDQVGLDWVAQEVFMEGDPERVEDCEVQEVEDSGRCAHVSPPLTTMTTSLTTMTTRKHSQGLLKLPQSLDL